MHPERCDDLQALPSHPVLTADAFLRRFADPARPAHITGALEQWPALRTWSLNGLKARAGRVRVGVTCSAPRTAAEADSPVAHPRSWRAEMTLAECVDAILGCPPPGTPPGTAHALTSTRLDALGNRLENDVPTPPHAAIVPGAVPHVWLGPAGKLVPWHWDGVDGLLCQVIGRKRLLVAPPGFDPEAAQTAPGHADKDVDPRRLCVLEPGDMLFIPQGWWHQVLYLDAGISINFWPAHYVV